MNRYPFSGFSADQIYIVTGQEALLDAVRAALKTKAIVQCADSASLLAAILRKTNSKAECVIIDLSLPDAERILTFIQSSPPIRNLPLVAVCSDEAYDALPEVVAYHLNGVVMTPYTAMEIAAAVASVCGPHDEGAQIRQTEPPPEAAP